MGRTKGAKNKATIEKLSCASERLRESQTEQEKLSRELAQQEELSLTAQQRAREIRKQLRDLDKEIAELEKMKLEWEENGKKAYDRDRLNAIIGQLVDSGVPADEIIRKLEGA